MAANVSAAPTPDANHRTRDVLMITRVPVETFRRFLTNASGSTAVIFGLTLLPLLLAAGAAVDFTNVTRTKTALQLAVDAAALVGAKNATLSSGAREQLARSTVYANLGTLQAKINPTVSGATPAAGKYAVTATANVPTSVMKLMQIDVVPISARATAIAMQPPATRVCLLAKSQTASPGLLANASASIFGPNCEIHVASTGNPAATFNSGNVFNVPKLCVAGTQILQNSVTLPTLSTGCATAADPFASTLPAVSVGACTVNDQNYTGNVTLSPGVYCGSFNFNASGSITLLPGLYIFKNTRWNLNTGWSINGSGVTFYFADDDSYVQINGGVTATLTAPTSGSYSDILMFEPPGLTQSSFTVNGGASHIFRGLVYLPSRNVTFNDMSNVTAEQMTIVVNSVILNTLNWNLQSSAGREITPPGAGTGAPRLVAD